MHKHHFCGEQSMYTDASILANITCSRATLTKIHAICDCDHRIRKKEHQVRLNHERSSFQKSQNKSCSPSELVERAPRTRPIQNIHDSYSLWFQWLGLRRITPYSTIVEFFELPARECKQFPWLIDTKSNDHVMWNFMRIYILFHWTVQL